MLFRNPFRPLNAGGPRRQPAPCRLAVEALDDRLVPASLSLSVGSAVVNEGNAGASAAAVVVTLSAPSRQTVTVNYATSDGAATLAGNDYVATSGVLVFAPGETAKTIAVPVISDRFPEPTEEQFFVNLTGARGAKIAGSYGVVTIANYDPIIRIAAEGRVYEGHSGTTSLTFIVSLSTASDQAVTVNYATADGTATVAGNDYVATSGMLVFAPGETTKTITVEVPGDTTPEPDEVFYVVLSGASVNPLLSNPVADGGIADDDGYYDAAYYDNFYYGDPGYGYDYGGYYYPGT